MVKLIGHPANGYVKRMEFTALEIKDTTSETWVKTPIGRACIYNKDGEYCKKHNSKHHRENYEACIIYLTTMV